MGVRHATAVDIEVKLNKPSWGQQQVVLLASLSEEDKEACLKAFTGETCYKCRPADDDVIYLFLQKPKLPQRCVVLQHHLLVSPGWFV
jgi:hypothetical protein